MPKWPWLAMMGIVVMLVFRGTQVNAGYVNMDVWDPNNSLNQSGIKTPRDYYEPPLLLLQKTDPEAFKQGRNKAYLASASLVASQAFEANGKQWGPGYYQVRLTDKKSMWGPNQLVVFKAGQVVTALAAQPAGQRIVVSCKQPVAQLFYDVQGVRPQPDLVYCHGKTQWQAVLQ